MAYFQNVNASADPAAALSAADVVFPRAACDAAAAAIGAWAGYCATPLLRLDGLARNLGLDAIVIKDESARFGLKSFKALGGAYAVEWLASRHGLPLTVVTATDGNHGRSVAWGAMRAGAAAKVLVHPGVSRPRREAIAAYGAEIIEVPGTYDDSVAAARSLADAHGWHLVADTAMDEADPVPALVMQGYTVLAREILGQWRGAAPTHVFLQVGVGGLAAAVAAELGRAWGAAHRCVAVEPEKADCLYRSLRAGAPRPAGGDLDTVMAGLSCGDVSLPAWTVLKTAVTDAMTIPDDRAIEAMRQLAFPHAGDPAIEAGESGGAGLAGLLHCCADHRLRAALSLDSRSRILLVNSEGATDPALFEALLGKEWKEPAR